MNSRRDVPRWARGIAPRLTLGVLLATPAPLASQPMGQPMGAPVVLQGPGLRMELSPRDGHLVRLGTPDGHLRAGRAIDSVGLWSLELTPGHPAGSIPSTAARQFRVSRQGASAAVLTWTGFDGTAAPRLTVRATVRLRPDSTSAWTIALEGIAETPIERVHFPRVTGIPVRSGDALAVPSWMGQQHRSPRRLLQDTAGRSRRLEFVYPGSTSMQFLALSDSSRGGWYFAADDTAAYRKHFTMWGEGTDSAGYALVHLLGDPGVGDRYAPSYAALLGTVPGDWLTAVFRYRAWGTRQPWARDSRLHRGATPAWLTNTGVWEWNRGRASGVLDPAVLLQQHVGLPVSVFWHWWHGGPYDTSFPDYLPPRDGVGPFTAAVARAHAAGLHAITYMNQRLWCTNTPSWTREGADRWAVRERDGSIRLETYNVFNPLPCATMDPFTPFWRTKYVGIADTVLTQYGIDGIYMDQAVLSLVDWNRDHGHPVGGGNYWMRGFRQLARDLRKVGGPSHAFAGEGGGESWMPDLDAFLTLQVSQERYADPASGWEVIPIFQAAYHPYALTYGTYGSLTLPPYDDLWPAEKRPANALALLDEKFVRQFHLEQARMFVWGMQPTIANFLPEQLTARPREMAQFARLARLRYRFREFLQHGTFLRPPAIAARRTDLLLSRISIYAARLGGPTEARITSPEVLSGAWRAPDGRVAIALAGLNLTSDSVSVTINPQSYGLPPGTRLIRHDESGTTPLGTLGAAARTLTLPLPSLGAVILELAPR